MHVNDDALDELYTAPLDEFTAVRDALAGSLKESGDADAAKQVKSLRKPSVAAWAVNQLAHRHADEMEKLLALRDEMEDAGAAQLRALGERRRSILAGLQKKASKILQDAGHGASAATLEKVTQSLQAGATDDEVELLKRGRLTRELSPSGFAGFGFAPAPETEAPTPSKAQDRARAKADELALKATEAEDEARSLERAAELARKHADAAARQAEVARRNATRARERADAAAERVD